MAKTWIFKDYVTADGENVVQGWFRGLSKRARAKVNLTITNLAVTDVWRAEAVKSLKGDCQGLFELRIFADNVQHRPLCFHGPGKREVTILMGAMEKGGKFVPASACATAKRRMASLEATPPGGTVCDHQE